MKVCVTGYDYDENGNLVGKNDADGYYTQSLYDERNLVKAIYYTNQKEAQFAYNKNGELIAMMDWNGTVNFSLDLLGRITSVNDQNEQITSYTYDEAGNQTSITYPDSTVAAYEYDLMGRLVSLEDAENQYVTYQRDNLGNPLYITYGNGWDEIYTYDDAGQMLTQLARDPADKINKQVLHTYSYDDQGNIINETGSGAGGQDPFDYSHSYDALNRLTETTGLWGYPTHTYEYDSLGNLLYEEIGSSKSNEYWYDYQNKQIRKQADGNKYYSNSFDRRGNLVKSIEETTGNIMEQYVYDVTNRMVKGTNEKGEESHYVYNGLGYRISNEQIIEKTNPDYHGIGATLAPSEQVNGVVYYDRHTNAPASLYIDPNGKGHTHTASGIIPNIDNSFAVVHKDYVLDYTSPLQSVIMEMENGNNDLTYRYSYAEQKANVVVYGVPSGPNSLLELQNYPTGPKNIVKLYFHHDRLGSIDYLTDNLNNEVAGYATYDDWGQLIDKVIVQNGARLLDLVMEYTVHPYDQVLDLYYAKARMYDAADRRFMAVDLVEGMSRNPQTLNQYIYCLDNSLKYIDPLGLFNERTKLSNKTHGRQFNSDVLTLQIRLLSTGDLLYSSNFTPGYFDKATSEAVSNYKNRMKLTNTGEYMGVVGVTTWDHLGLLRDETRKSYLTAPGGTVPVDPGVNTGRAQAFYELDALLYRIQRMALGSATGDTQYQWTYLDFSYASKYYEKLQCAIERKTTIQILSFTPDVVINLVKNFLQAPPMDPYSTAFYALGQTAFDVISNTTPSTQEEVRKLLERLDKTDKKIAEASLLYAQILQSDLKYVLTRDAPIIKDKHLIPVAVSEVQKNYVNDLINLAHGYYISMVNAPGDYTKNYYKAALAYVENIISLNIYKPYAQELENHYLGQ